MRRPVWIGSLAVHAVVGALLASVVGHRREPSHISAAIEVIDIAVAPRAVPEPSGGGGGEPRVTEPRVRSTQQRARSSARSVASRTDDDPRGEVRFDTGGDGGGGGGTGGGDGTGRGAGRGAGIGFGDGGGIAQQAEPTPPPPAPKISKARPARLIFPNRQRDAEDGELFVMQVTVDRDGFVAGAKLVRGFGGRRDEVASNQIWRFRYAPALDDDGLPIRSSVEQRFLVQ